MCRWVSTDQGPDGRGPNDFLRGSVTKATRQRLIGLLKLLVGSGLIALLLWQAAQGDHVREVLDGKKNWWLFGTAAGFIASAVVINFFRWWLLVRAADLPMSLAEAMRLGALGHAANFVGPGSVGGDLLKAVLFARNHSGRRSAAVATVLADRFLGLLTLLALAAVAGTYAFATGLLESAPMLRGVSATVIGLAIVSWLGAAAAFLPGPHANWLTAWLPKLPLAGPIAKELFVAVQSMHKKPAHLPIAIACSVVSHILLVLSFVAVSYALPTVRTPNLTACFTAIPLAELVGALPLLPGGLGATETALKYLYQALGAGADDGTFVAIGQRLVNISVGLLAVIYYLTQRQTMEPAMEEAEAIRER